MDSIGIKLGIQGEREFKEALKDTNAQMKLMGAELKLVASQFDATDKSQAALTARGDALRNSISTQTEKVDTLKNALQHAANSYGESDKRTVNWKTQLALAEAELNKLDSELEKNEKAMKDAASGMDAFGKNTEAGHAGVKTLGNLLGENLSKSASETKDKIVGLASGFVNFAKDTVTGENSVKSLGDALANKLKGNLDETGESADKAEKELKESGNAASDSESKFSKLGDVLKGSAAAMGAFALAAGAAIAGTVKALADFSVGTAAYADDILTMSTVTGMSTDTLQEYKYAADLVDVSMETLTGTMAKNIKSMDKARDAIVAGKGSTNDMVKAYESLGIAVSFPNGELKDSEYIYWKAIDALGEMEEGAERDALAMTIFGKSAQDLNPLIAQGSKGFAELSEEARKAGVVLSSDQLNMAGDFDDTVQKLTQGSNAAKNALGMVLMPVLNELGGTGVDLLGQFTTALNESDGDFSKFGETVGILVTGVTDSLFQMLPQILELATSIVGGLAQGIIDNLPLILDSAVEIVLQLISGVIEALPQIVEAALQLVMSLVEGLTTAIPKLIPAIIEVVTGIAEMLIDNIPLLIDAALKLVIALATGIIDALPKLVEKIPKIITSIVATLKDNIPTIIETGVKLLVSLIENLPSIINTIVDALPQLIHSVVDYILNNIPVLIDAGIQLFIALVHSLPEIILTIVKVIPSIIKSIVTAIVEHIPELAKAGLNLIKGLWQGISDAGQWLRDKISGFFGGVVDSIKNFFGINSPSTLFAELGDYMAQGLGIGFGDEMKSVGRDMQNAIPSQFDTDVDFNINARQKARNSLADILAQFETVDAAVAPLLGDYSSAATDSGIMDVTIQLVLDGSVLTNKTSRVAYAHNQAHIRAYGL